MVAATFEDELLESSAYTPWIFKIIELSKLSGKRRLIWGDDIEILKIKIKSVNKNKSINDNYNHLFV